MFRFAIILCVLLQGWIAVEAAPMAATLCAECTTVASAPADDEGCCSCCTGGECCCRAESRSSPTLPTPGPKAIDLLEQLGRLAAIPVRIVDWTSTEKSAAANVGYTPRRSLESSAHLDRVISTTHLLV